jgi:hypothetical protein
MFPLGAHDARSVPFVRCGSFCQALVDLGGLQALLTYTYRALAVLSFGQDGHGVGATVACRAVPAAEDVGLDQLHRDDLLRFHSHRSFNASPYWSSNISFGKLLVGAFQHKIIAAVR